MKFIEAAGLAIVICQMKYLAETLSTMRRLSDVRIGGLHEILP